MLPPSIRIVVVVLSCFGGGAVRAQEAFFGAPRVVFFPPTPPIYGAAIPDQPALAPRLFGNRRMSPPDGLAVFVCDVFYPPLSTRLFVPELNSTLEVRLHLYREKRLRQIQALLNEFVALNDATPEVWEQQLHGFAAGQTPQLVALEGEGEQLRRDLITTGIFRNVDWNAGRRWRVGTIHSKGDWAEAEAEFQVVRAAAYYQNGLLPPQRGLVRELAIELERISWMARGLPALRDESDAMFFSPETARFRIPADAPAAARERLGTYNAQKTALKRELRGAIQEGETLSAAQRDQLFEALADRQWPQLRMLDELAEEIRGILGLKVEVTPPPPPPWLPAGLMAAIRSYNEDRDTFFGEMKAAADDAVAKLPPEPYIAPEDRIQSRRDQAARVAESREMASKAFQQRNQERFQELAARFKAIRDSLSVVAEKQKDRKTGRPLDADALLRQYGASMREFDAFGRESALYGHYRIAMWQRGLSPEQRRLLFGYALMSLAQPLPGGEPLPRTSATRPYPSW
jgi:hypothetical protein